VLKTLAFVSDRRVSQDVLGKQGRLVHTLQQNPGNVTVEIYTRQLTGGDLAVA